MSRYLVQHEDESRLALIVDVVDDAFARVDEMRELMLDVGCAHAMIVDWRDVIVMRDTFFEMDDSSIKVDFSVATEDLLGPGDDLDIRVRQWLRRMSNDWRATLSGVGKRQELLYDIVPALSGAVIDHVDDSAA